MHAYSHALYNMHTRTHTYHSDCEKTSIEVIAMKSNLNLKLKPWKKIQFLPQKWPNSFVNAWFKMYTNQYLFVGIRINKIGQFVEKRMWSLKTYVYEAGARFKCMCPLLFYFWSCITKSDHHDDIMWFLKWCETMHIVWCKIISFFLWVLPLIKLRMK